MLLTRLPLSIAGAFDLHVLGLPPAFALSQDQTLKLDEIDSGRSHVLTRSHYCPLQRLLAEMDISDDLKR